MTNNLTFNEAMKKHLQTLKQYVPIVARVHGGNHPEFHEVRKLFDTIATKTKDAGSNKPKLNEEFARLREITDTYTVPGDVCESYEAVYSMLAELDRAYRAG
ncbi:MAG: iron-sulfur cluster repair di-iron protein, ric [Methanomicrobiales archaeon HGW-Methanomicrobiales-2]|jgi:regulator of cell morphogenesis and NO signaling|nr:MAG: iron-sulfur cluster repair di-iron protein, ric [Methanomicrobiales archaeon HGW-Methanomicrobiales-2]